jgi:hypothetical protein
MKNIKLLSVIFITSLMLSLALPVIGLTMNEKKVRDIQALHSALLQGQRIVLDSSSTCKPSWVQDTGITLHSDSKGNPISIHIDTNGSQLINDCNDINLDSIKGIRVEEIPSGEIVKSIYW